MISLRSLLLFLVQCVSLMRAEEEVDPLFHSNSTYFEGDIIPMYGTILELYGEDVANSLEYKEGDGPDNVTESPIVPIDEEGTVQSGSTTAYKLWNTKLSEKYETFVVYVYIETSDYTPEQVNTIKKSLKKLGKKTGVLRFNFQNSKPTEKPFINIGVSSSDPNICGLSYIGRTYYSTAANGQPISISKGCVNRGVIQHEMMHALGFFHEQSRPDRDDYVNINYNNIVGGQNGPYASNFAKTSKIDSLGAPYDYDSVMHYDEYAFSNGGPTIDANGNDIGQRVEISQGDIIQIRLLYQCEDGRQRTLEEYREKKCRKDCKCGKGVKGCGTNDNVCKGSLACIDNKCKKKK